MLYQSGLLTDLQRYAWANGQPLCIYGDPAYPLSLHLQAPFRNAVLTPQMAQFNRCMSEVRVSVEWMFGTISNYYKFLDFKKQLRIGSSPVGKIYLVCGIFQIATHASMVTLYQSILTYHLQIFKIISCKILIMYSLIQLHVLMYAIQGRIEDF